MRIHDIKLLQAPAQAATGPLPIQPGRIIPSGRYFDHALLDGSRDIRVLMVDSEVNIVTWWPRRRSSAVSHTITFSAPPFT